MGLGMLECFELSEAVGDKALSHEEVLFMAEARKRKGCRMIKSTLTVEERKRVLALGKRCKEWKEQNR